MTDKKPIPKAQVRKTQHGWQVYAGGPKGHIAQGQPHKDLGAAKRDAKKFEEAELDEGPLQDRRRAQAKKRQAMDALRRKQAQQKQLASRAAREKEKSDIASRRDIRSAQASKHAQKNWRAEATAIVDEVASQLTAGFDPFSHKVPRKPSRMSQKDYDYKYKATKVGKPVRNPKKNTGMKTPETQAALKYLKGKGPSPYGPGGKYEPKKESTYSERIASEVPEGNASGAKGSKKKELFKARKFRNTTPGQSRDFEKLSAHRMFQAYEQKTDEDAPTTSTAGVANWDPLLGGKKARVYFKKRRKVDGRTKDYKETIQRVQARRDREAARELEQKLNMFGVQSNPFKEETEMNKKYLTTRKGSLEEAVLTSLGTEKPVNPNDARPTLHLPKKYLSSKDESLESAVSQVLTEAGATKKQVKMAKGIAFDPRHKGGDMTGAWKKAEKIKKGLGDHPSVQKSLRKANEGISAAGRGERDVGSQAYTDYVKNLTPGEGDSAVTDRDAQKSAKASQDVNKEKKLRTTRIDDEYIAEKEVDVKDTRRTVDAIRAYDRSKDASRDADWDTEHGKKKKGDKEKKYAKKERGEIDKDDPDWKHRKYHTGIHGEGIKHDCASHVKHEEHGVGKCLPGQHTIVETEDGEGYVTHYDVMFDSTIVKDIPVEELDILEIWPHTHGKKKVKEETGAEAGHATALYKDQWKDRKRADWDKEHGREKMAKQDRADAEVDRKRMWAISKDQWKHAKYSTGEEEGKRTIDGNTPSPKDAYKEEMSPLIRATIDQIHSFSEKKLSYKERQGLSTSQFALPGKGSGPEGKQGGSYPIPDESHARNALARVSQHGSEAEKAKVRAAVRKKFPGIDVSEDTDRSPDKSGGKGVETPDEIMGVKVKKIKPSLKGMSKSAKRIHKFRLSREEVEMKEGEWADEKRKEKESSDRLLRIHKEREARYQAQQRKKKQTKEEVELDEKSARDPERRAAREISRSGSDMERDGKPGWWSSRTPGKRKHGGYSSMGYPQRSGKTGRITGGSKVSVDDPGDTGPRVAGASSSAGLAAHRAERGVKKVRGAKEPSALKKRLLQKSQPKKDIGPDRTIKQPEGPGRQ